MVASCQAISLFSQNSAFNQKVGDHHHHHHRCCHRQHGHYDRRSSNDNFTSLIRFSSISHVSSSSSYPLSSPAAFSVPLFATTPRFAIICSFMLQNLSNSCFHRLSLKSPLSNSIAFSIIQRFWHDIISECEYDWCMTRVNIGSANSLNKLGATFGQPLPQAKKVLQSLCIETNEASRRGLPN